MAVLDVELAQESQTRYLTYALSVVSSRALPDVRDGLKPVQRRILYAMQQNLHLSPDRPHRKSAAVVGEVLARYHPHGDSACYEAMVRMAQDFSMRYPMVDGQGNFGSLDGDGAAAYRYTEARLTDFALEVIGDINQNTVSERDNFDQTVQEPVVLPSRVPNLLVNGSAGIAVGMATAIPPHNLRDVVKALLLLIEDDSVSDNRLVSAVKGPDFPTGCLILNSQKELREIYSSGRGAIRMRASHAMEKAGGKNSKERVVITSIPYGVDKSGLIEKIADLIISRKVPQLVDVRDESTDEVRIVMELAADADPEKALAYLFKHTPLQQNFNVNLTALIPTQNPLTGRPELLSLREMLSQFVTFRVEVTRAKLEFEKSKLEERIHLLEGLITVIDVLDEVIKIVRKSEGRTDAAKKLRARFKLTELQAFFIVDLRIYQLSKTNVNEVTAELREKQKRVAEINKILKSRKALNGEVASDLERISAEYGDERRSKIVSDFEELEFDKEEYVQHEDAIAIVTQDGWLKRIRPTNDPETTRMREGDSLFFAQEASTRDTLIILTSFGNLFGLQIFDMLSTNGFGEPVQKMFRFQDGEQIVSCMVLKRDEQEKNGRTGNAKKNGQGKQPTQEIFQFQDGSPVIELTKVEKLGKKGGGSEADILLYSEQGFGFRLPVSQLGVTKKTGRRMMRLQKGDHLRGVCPVINKMLLGVSEQGYAVCFHCSEVPVLSGSGKGVILQKLPKDDRLVVLRSVEKKGKVRVLVEGGKKKEIDVGAMTIGSRAKRGLKLVKRGGPVVGPA